MGELEDRILPQVGEAILDVLDGSKRAMEVTIDAGVPAVGSEGPTHAPTKVRVFVVSEEEAPKVHDALAESLDRAPRQDG